MFRRPLFALLLACLSSLLLALGTLLYAHFVGPYQVEESHWELRAEHWKGRPLRIVVLADLHAKSGDGAYMDEIVQRTLALQPDLVVLLGDYINDPQLGDSMDVATLGRHLAPLAQLPCFAVFGNHDHDYGIPALQNMLQGFGAQVVEGKMQALEIGGDTLYLGGMRCLCRFNTPGKGEALPEGAAPATYLLLTHSPVGAHYAPQEVTATLAAHTHGGQVCLPGGVPFIRPDQRVDWREMKGEVQTQGKPVYVTRGLGTSMVPLRLWCRPELAVVELKGGRGVGK